MENKIFVILNPPNLGSAALYNLVSNNCWLIVVLNKKLDKEEMEEFDKNCTARRNAFTYVESDPYSPNTAAVIKDLIERAVA